MAEQSFYEMLIIDTPEKAENIRKAFEDAEKRGPLVFDIDIAAELKRGKERIRLGLV